MALFNLSKEQVEQIKKQRELADKSFFKRLRKRLGIAFATIGLASGSAAVAEINRQQEKSKDAQAEEVKTNDYGEVGADEALKNRGIQIEEEMPIPEQVVNNVPDKVIDNKQDSVEQISNSDLKTNNRKKVMKDDFGNIIKRNYLKTDYEDLTRGDIQEDLSTKKIDESIQDQSVVQPVQPVQTVQSTPEQQTAPSQEQVVIPTTSEQPSSEKQGVTLVGLNCTWNNVPGGELNETNCIVKNGYVDTSLFSVWASFSDGTTVLDPAGFEWLKGVDVTTEDGKPAWKYVPDMVKYKFGDVELTAGCEVPVFGKELGREEKDNVQEALDTNGGIVSSDVADNIQENVDEEIKKAEEEKEEIKNENDNNTSLDVDIKETPDTTEIPEVPSQDSSSETPPEQETTAEEVVTVDSSDDDFFTPEDETTQEKAEEQTQAVETTQETAEEQTQAVETTQETAEEQTQAVETTQETAEEQTQAVETAQEKAEEQTQAVETTQETAEEQTQATESIEGLEQVDLDYTAAAEAYKQAVEESNKETQSSSELGALADLVNSPEEVVEYTQGTTEYNDIIPGQDAQEQSNDMNR